MNQHVEAISPPNGRYASFIAKTSSYSEYRRSVALRQGRMKCDNNFLLPMKTRGERHSHSRLPWLRLPDARAWYMPVQVCECSRHEQSVLRKAYSIGRHYTAQAHHRSVHPA